DFIGMLPLEISTRILEYVPIIDIVKNASFVSRQWYAATTQPCLWHRLFRRQGWGIDKERWALYYSLPCSLTSKQPVDWRKLYSEYHRLLVNWRDGKCRVDRWESAHAESVYCLQFDQNNRLFTGSRDRTVKLWHLSETGSQIVPLATLKGHSGSVLTLQADDNTLITGSSDGTMCIWSMDTYTIVHRLVHPDSVLSLRFNDKWLATACKDRVVRVWRRDQGYKDVFELLGHAVAINAIHLYEDTLVSASGDRTIKIWDLKTRTCVQTLADHTRGVACLDFDGTYIVSGSSDRSIRIWDAVTGACQRVIHNAHTDLVRTVMFNRKQDILVSGSYDESIKIWSLSTGALMHKIKNVHTSRVFKLMFDRSRIISCSHDRSVSIIDFA
ncbi:WD40-repeat-containing domain protein, partial [Coemansia spiralis]